MTPFGILTPPRILFGRGEAARASVLIRAFGGRGVLVHGASPERSAWLADALRAAGTRVLVMGCPSEPVLDMVQAGVEQARAFRPDWVVGMGGGAALDFGKALAALIPSASPALDHLEVVGKGLPLGADPLPFIALPTTSGTGTEATRNAVIGVPAQGRKVSLRDDRMIPRLAIVDPGLTDFCPRAVTLASGLDAVVQVIEPYLSGKATPFTDALTRPAIGQGLAALVRLMATEDAAARDAIAWVSLCGGMALTNAALGAVHGLAGVIGGLTPAPHGLICGRLIGPVLRANLRHAPDRARLSEVCVILAGILGGPPEDAPETLAHWASDMGLAPLRSFDLSPDRFLSVAEAAQASSSMRGNPVPLAAGALVDVLQQEADLP